jgi:hypothetical protein
MRLLRILPLILLTLDLPAYALGRTVSYEELFAHFKPNITAVQKCGRVVVGDDRGYFRLIQAHIYGSTMLFVDAVVHTNRDPYLQVLRGFSFDELNNDHLDQDLTELSCVGPEWNQIIVTGRAHPFERDEFLFRLDLDSSSRSYTFVRQPF